MFCFSASHIILFIISPVPRWGKKIPLSIAKQMLSDESVHKHVSESSASQALLDYSQGTIRYTSVVNVFVFGFKVLIPLLLRYIK